MSSRSDYLSVCCSLYDSDISQDWYSPSYSPPDHAYTPTGDALPPRDDDYPSDWYDYHQRPYNDYNNDYSVDDDDWRYDNEHRPRGTGRKLPAPPPGTGADDYSSQWQSAATPTINGGGDYIAAPLAPPLAPPGDSAQSRQPAPDTAQTLPPLVNGYTEVMTVSLNMLLTINKNLAVARTCLLYTSPSPRDRQKSRMPSSA